MRYKVLFSIIAISGYMYATTSSYKPFIKTSNMKMTSQENTILNTSLAEPQVKSETIFLKGKPIQTIGSLPQKGTEAPDFTGTDKDLNDISLKDFKGKTVVLNIFPSLDTPTCAASVRYFNETASTLNQTVVLCISMDLPFAQRRFCTTEGLNNVLPISIFRSDSFKKNYPILIKEGPMKDLCARAVIVIDANGKIIYTELVKEISEEPNYDAILKILK